MNDKRRRLEALEERFPAPDEEVKRKAEHVRLLEAMTNEELRLVETLLSGLRASPAAEWKSSETYRKLRAIYGTVAKRLEAAASCGTDPKRDVEPSA